MGTITSLTNQLQNLIPSKLLDDDPLEEKNWNKVIDYLNKNLDIVKEIDQRISPVGLIYFQMPNKKPPSDFYPGTTWQDVSFEWADRFLRVKSVSGYGTGSAGGHGTLKSDAIRNITGTTAWTQCDNLEKNTSSEGAFVSRTRRGGVDNGWGHDTCVQYVFSADREVPTAEENRPYSMAFTIWECIA